MGAEIQSLLFKAILFNLIIGLTLTSGALLSGGETSGETPTDSLMNMTTAQLLGITGNDGIDEHAINESVSTIQDGLRDPTNDEKGWFQKVWEGGVQAIEGAVNVFRLIVGVVALIAMGFAKPFFITFSSLGGKPLIIMVTERAISLIAIVINVTFVIAIYDKIINKK